MSFNLWFFLAVIIVVSVVSNAVVQIMKSRGRGAAPRMKDLESDIAALELDLEDARERIVVLEKIVTDNKYNLGRQIDDLEPGAPGNE